jgi:hypothetical protein
MSTICCFADASRRRKRERVSSWNKTVGALKKVIKDENSHSFHGIDARNLTLWRVSIPSTRQLAKNVIELNLNDRDPLHSTLSRSWDTLT